jgi:hypothetical protein
MLDAWLERLLTTCPVYLQDMGCLREMLGIRRRWRLYRDAWEPHVHFTTATILAAAGRCGRKRKGVVLGSGWLHDVPLEQLAGLFQEVVLIDLFHPFFVRRQVRRHGNVRLVAADVTETLHEVWRVGHQPGAVLPRPTPTRFVGDADLDLTVSLNLLSQLPCLPESYLRELGALSNEVILGYCRGLVESHLDYLRAMPGVVALLTDVEARTVSFNGQEVSREPTLYGVSLPWRGQSWEWDIVPGRRARSQHAEVLTVVGIEDIKDTKRA